MCFSKRIALNCLRFQIYEYVNSTLWVSMDTAQEKMH